MDAVITIHKHCDKHDFCVELEASGSGCIKRACTCTDHQPLSTRNVTFDLTEIEIINLKNDDRVIDVITVDELENIPCGPHIERSINPPFTFLQTQTDDNWGLWAGTNRSTANPPLNDTYRFSHTGIGVDVVILDTGIKPNHPEFGARVQQIEWQANQFIDKPNFYDDTNGHGSHTAGIVAGATQGWAPGADIYVMKILGEPDSYPNLTALQLVRAWHNAKTNGRPTVCNNSWGYYNTYPSNYPDPTLAGTPHPWQVASVDAEIQSMIDDGIIWVASAGNDSHTVANSSDPLYNDFYYITSGGLYTANSSLASGLRFYNTGTPFADEAICVGALGDYAAFPYTAHMLAGYSNKGSQITIFAPGTSIQSANYQYVTGDDFVKISGTSMAGPQVAGVLALYAGMNPAATQADCKAWLTEHAYTATIADSPTNTVDASPQQSLFSMFVGVYVKEMGVWELVLQPSIKDGGTWNNPQSISIKDSGTWKKTYG